jgi:hypothetical protein
MDILNKKKLPTLPWLTEEKHFNFIFLPAPPPLTGLLPLSPVLLRAPTPDSSSFLHGRLVAWERGRRIAAMLRQISASDGRGASDHRGGGDDASEDLDTYRVVLSVDPLAVLAVVSAASGRDVPHEMRHRGGINELAGIVARQARCILPQESWDPGRS